MDRGRDGTEITFAPPRAVRTATLQFRETEVVHGSMAPHQKWREATRKGNAHWYSCLQVGLRDESPTKIANMLGSVAL